jgi:hypothetical protein
MGFGPTLPSADEAVQAVIDIVRLLYPERATAEALAVLKRLAATLLEAGAPLSFETMAKFLADPAWRTAVLTRAPNAGDAWTPYGERLIVPEELNADFAWLLRDRLANLADES